MKAYAGSVRLPTLDRARLGTVIRPATPAVELLVVGVLARPGDARLAEGVGAGLARRPDLLVDVRPATVEAPYRAAAVVAARMLEGGARVIVTDLPARALRRLAPLCRQYGAALVALGTGSLEVPDPIDGVVHVTELRWQASFALGDWSARHLDERLFQIIAAPDAQFEVVDALVRGHRGAGGVVAGSATTHDRATGTGVEDAAMAALLAEAGTVAVHAGGARAHDIVRAVRRTCGDVAIVLDGPDDREVAELSRRFGAVYSARAAGAGSTAEDAGLLIAFAGTQIADERPWSDLTRVLAGVTVAGVAGPVTLDPLTHTIVSQVAVRRTSAGRPSVVARRSA